MSLPAQIAVLMAVLVAVTGLALAAGAANLGTALGIGQVVFTLALIALLLRR